MLYKLPSDAATLLLWSFPCPRLARTRKFLLIFASYLVQAREKYNMKWDSDFAKAILLVLDAQSTDQENLFQATHEQEAQNAVVLHLDEMQFYTIFRQRNYDQNKIVIHSLYKAIELHVS